MNLRTATFRVALGILLSVGLASSPGCSRRVPEPLRIGTNPWPGYEFIHLAAQKGFFKDAGLDVRLVEFASLSDVRRAYERGQVDAMATTVIEVLQARDQSDRAPQIVRVMDYSNGADVILSRPKITRISQLRGARVGVELASLGVYVLVRGIENDSLSLSDIKPTSMDQLSMQEAFQKGELDAIVTYPPTSIQLMRDSTVHVLYSTATIPGEVVDVLAFDSEVILKRKTDVQQFLAAIDRAMDFARKNPDEAHLIMATHEGITPQEFRAALTDGIHVVEGAELALYFGPSGKLSQVVDRSDHILRLTGQIKGKDRRDGVVGPVLFGGGSAP